jgi:hypothetical protein
VYGGPPAMRFRRNLLRVPAGVALLAMPTTRMPGPGPDHSIPRIVHKVQVSSDHPTARHVESVLAVNPRDPKNLVAAAMVLDSGEVAVYASRDSGRSWRRATPGGDRTSRFGSLDPAVAFDQDGSAYFIAVGPELEVWKSSDGGFTWASPSIVPGKSWDRPWIACTPRRTVDSPLGIYVAGKLPIKVFGHSASDVIALSASDRSETLPFPRLLLPAPEKELLNIVSDLVVDADGRIFLVLQLFPPTAIRETLLSGSYSTIVSEDGGRTFSSPRRGPEFHVYGHAQEGKSLFALGGARLAIDKSGRSRNGRFYLTWLDLIDGFYQVLVSFSADQGETWSEPIRVSDVTEADASTPSIAVDGEGTVGVVWYDRRADPANGCYQLYFSASRDGSAVFSANQLLDATTTCPLATGSRVAGPSDGAEDPVTSEYRFKNGGDTQGIVGLPDGGFHLAWIQAGSREMQLWTAEVVLDGSSKEPTTSQRPKKREVTRLRPTAELSGPR